jgi:hypothetical protein
VGDGSFCVKLETILTDPFSTKSPGCGDPYAS